MAESRQDKQEQAAREQLKVAADERKKQEEQRAAMAKGKPTPTQEENDLARLGVPIDEHEDDGSMKESDMRHTRAMEPTTGRPSAGYQTRSPATPPKPAS